MVLIRDMRATAVFVVLWSGVALGRGVDMKVLGWTPDGQKFAYLPPTDWIGEPNEMGYGEGSAEYGEVIDGRTGVVTRYLLELHGTPLADEKAKLDKLPNKAAWKALIGQKLSCAGSGRKGPDGTVADVKVSGKHMRGKWGKKTFTFEFDPGDDEDSMMSEKSATLSFSVARGAAKVATGGWAGQSTMGEAGGGLSGEVRLCFSPGGQRVAYVVRRAPSMMRDTGDVSAVVAGTTVPRVQIVADKAVLDAAVGKVAPLIEAAGFWPSGIKPSNEATPRPATVVYAAKGFEADAAKLAAAVPGGATVGVMDWKSGFDLVVGVGASALK
jgi:hypothetical protein